MNAVSYFSPAMPAGFAMPPGMSGSGVGAATAKTGTSSASFRDFMLGSIQEVNGMQQDAEKAMETLLTGGEILPAEVLTSVQKADLSLKMLMQVRNKLVAAYQELKDVRI